MVTEINLLEFRKQLGESQVQFGLRFGVDQSTIHRWETRGIPKKGPARLAIELTLQQLESARTLLRVPTGRSASL